jgi:hypothetical protein
MAFVIADRVRETTTTTGPGSVTLLGAAASYQTFSVIGNGNSTFYAIAGQGTTEWETGFGTYTSSGNTLSRDAIYASSNGGSAVSFSAGTKDVFITQPAEKSPLPRVYSVASISAITPNINLYNEYAITALATGLTINAPTGNPVDGDKLIFRILDDGSSSTGFSITWNVPPYTAIGVSLIYNTTKNKTLYVGCLYNANNTRWDVVAVSQQI